jgi:hypothetical protein
MKSADLSGSRYRNGNLASKLRKTPWKPASAEKVRIVIEGLRGNQSIPERHEEPATILEDALAFDANGNEQSWIAVDSKTP